MTCAIATFYQFVDLPDYEAKRATIEACCQKHGIKGTILLAEEGINGTITGTDSGIKAIIDWLRSDPRLRNLTYRESHAETLSFQRLKVRCKSEIVTLGMPNVNPTQQTGQPVSPEEWNQLLDDPEVLTIDTRNDYEVSIGTFKGAKNPQTQTFRDFPDYVQQQLNPQKHKKVAMFCTGGIRCEKASAYLLRQGFEQVYQLQGGILNYLEQIPEAQSQWQGECFVFDERVAVKTGLETGSYDMCLSCGHPISVTDQASEHYQPGITCPHCYETITQEKVRRQKARWQSQKSKGKSQKLDGKCGMGESSKKLKNKTHGRSH